jgi:acyl-coenzyme A thioesterase PaaI-like protein
MNVAMLTTREGQLAALREGLEQRQAQVERFADAWSLLQAARTRSWNLVILDGLSTPFRELVEQLLEINAGLHIAVITEMEPEEFHEASEGLGLLSPLHRGAGAAAVGPLLEKLQAVGGFHPEVEAAQAQLGITRQELHEYCVVCSQRHPLGLHAGYRAVSEHAVEASFPCGKGYEGYRNVLHGGIVSALLDGAMANCIFAKGLEAYTVDLRIRFRAPVEIGVSALVRGEWLRQDGKLHLLQASIVQDGKVRASARAKFMEGSPNAAPAPMPRGVSARALVKESHQRARRS